jgi:hypothetical protein
MTVVSAVMTPGKRVAGNDTAIFVTERVRREPSGTSWHTRLRRVDVGAGHRDRLVEIQVFRLGGLRA